MNISYDAAPMITMRHIVIVIIFCGFTTMHKYHDFPGPIGVSVIPIMYDIFSAKLYEEMGINMCQDYLYQSSKCS